MTTQRDAITGKVDPKGCQSWHEDSIRDRKCGRKGRWYTSVKLDASKLVRVFRCDQHVPTFSPSQGFTVLPGYMEMLPEAVPA